MRKVLKFVAISIAVVALISVAILLFIFIYVRKNIDYRSDEELFLSSKTFESTVFYANGGTPEEYLPVAFENTGNLKKSYVPINNIPEKIKKGFIAVEDRKFYTHSGIDVKRTALAAVNYILGREKVFGASTITQQVIKNVSGDNEVTVSRKFSEILRARHIEKCFEKDEILEVYLNIIPMGEEIYGIEESSKLFFGKELYELTDAEIATLIGITNAPTAYNPYKNPEKCIKKRNSVLSVLFSEGVINKQEYDLALEEKLSPIEKEDREDRFDSWFTEAVIDSVSEDLAKERGISPSASRLLLSSGGFSVYTTMNIEVQKILEEYFTDPKNFPEEINKGLNYAMTVLDSDGATLLGIIGRVGEKRGNRLLNHAKIPHVPASTLKPLALYAPLIDDGVINYATAFDDVPIEFYENEGELRPYPRNSPDIYDGLTGIKDAVRLSKNTIAVKLCKQIGTKNIFKRLKEGFEFETLVEKEVRDGKSYTDIAISPLALGQLTDGVPLLKLCEAYTVFPGGGKLTKTRNYLYVKDHKGNIVLEKEEESKRLYKESTAKIMNKLLSGVVESGTAKSISLKNFVNTAGKTGTSGNNKDKLFVGYTPYYTAGIWCGYDSGEQIYNLSKGHLSIWDEVMTKIHEATVSGEKREFSYDGLLYRAYCKDSGKLYSESCIYDPRGDRIEYGYFTEDNLPRELCDVHVLVNYDTEGKGIATRSCPENTVTKVALIKVTRSFPAEISVTDAEFVYRDISGYEKNPGENYPYFYSSLDNGEYAGVTGRKKQFNRYCQKHR